MELTKFVGQCLIARGRRIMLKKNKKKMMMKNTEVSDPRDLTWVAFSAKVKLSFIGERNGAHTIFKKNNFFINNNDSDNNKNKCYPYGLYSPLLATCQRHIIQFLWVFPLIMY